MNRSPSPISPNVQNTSEGRQLVALNLNLPNSCF